MPHAALTTAERAVLREAVRKIGVAGAARKYGLSRHAVMALISAETTPRPGTVALARERMASIAGEAP